MNEIIIDYLKVILDWPFLGALLIFWFLSSHKIEVRKILRGVKLKKIGSAEFGQVEVGEIASQPKIIPSSEHDWEMKFYGQVVARSTMSSLLWLHNQGASTKSHFFQNMVCPVGIPDVQLEKEAQFSIMISYKFIDLDKNEVYKVSSKGEKLLKYYKLL